MSKAPKAAAPPNAAQARPAAADAASAASPPRKSRKKLVMLAAPLLLLAIGAGLWFGGILPPLLGMGKAAEHAAQAQAQGPAAGEAAAGAEAAVKPPVFVDLPDLVANLNSGQRRTSFIKLKARLELVRPEDQATVQALMPRLQDLFTTYLREVRPEELRGSAGTYRLREELLARANIAVAPARVADVLFTEMLVQ